MERFFREVARVLKPGGHFSIIDVFDARSTKRFSELQEIQDFEWIYERDATPKFVAEYESYRHHLARRA